jgi:rod shape-determining protein MreC
MFILPRGFFLPERFIFQAIFSPIENIVSGSGFFFRDIVETLTSIGTLKEENVHLKAENVKHVAEGALLSDIQKENDELRKELSLPLRKRFNMISATVIAKDAANRGKWIVIAAGSLDGVSKGMAVVAVPGVMIGVIDEVYPKSARVMLLSHPESAIPGRIAGQNTRGIVRGEHALGMRFGMVSQTDTMQNGDFVVTDNLEEKIPSGLLIGTAQSVGPSPDHLFLEASIVLSFRVESLRFVSVIITEREAS